LSTTLSYGTTRDNVSTKELPENKLSNGGVGVSPARSIGTGKMPIPQREWIFFYLEVPNYIAYAFFGNCGY
jgi:hypothetical protein